MAHDHVAIPRFIEQGFSTNGKVFCYDLINNKIYKHNIDRLGTENSYYDEYVEKEVLANGIENNFASFYKKFMMAKTLDEHWNLVDDNKDLIVKFFSFMFVRAKRTLEDINDKSIIAQIFGDFSHSTLLAIQNKLNMDPLKIIKEDYVIVPLLNDGEYEFTNNSLGFSIMENQGIINFAIPLSTKKAIIIGGISSGLDSKKVYTLNSKEDIQIFNKLNARFEVAYGNGFIFSKSNDDIEFLMNYIIELKKKNNITLL